MKTLFVLPVAAVILAGCAAPPPRYAQRPVNPYDWHTVSVTPVQPGTVAAQGGHTEYTTEPAPVYVQQPVYVEQPVYPVYAPAPAYYYPPVSIGLDFVFTNRRGGGWWRGRHR